MKKITQIMGATYQRVGRLGVIGILIVLLLGVLYSSIEQNFFQNLKKQLAAVLGAESCVSQGEYDTKKSLVTDLEDNLVSKFVEIDTIKTRLATLEAEAGKAVAEIKKIQASTTPTDTLELKLASKQSELSDLNALISQRNSINISEAGLPKTKANLQKKETEKTNLTKDLSTLKTRITSLEKIEQLKVQLDDATKKADALKTESDDRSSIDTFEYTQATLTSQIKYWKSFKNNPAAAKMVASYQEQFDKNKTKVDAIKKKYTNAQGVFTLRSAALILGDYYKISTTKNTVSYNLSVATYQYNTAYAKDPKTTLVDLKKKIDDTNVAIAQKDKDITSLKKEIDTATNQLPGLKNDWIAKVKEYYKKYYNKTETIASFAAAKLTDVVSVESEIKKTGDSIKDIKDKNKAVIEKKQAAELAFNNQITKINTTRDALVVLQNEKESLVKSIDDAKKKIESLNVCVIPKIQNTVTNPVASSTIEIKTVVGTSTVSSTSTASSTTLNTATVSTTSTSINSQVIDEPLDDGPKIVSIYPEDRQQISSLDDAQFTVYFDRPVTMGSGAGYLNGANFLMQGDSISVTADKYTHQGQTGEITFGFSFDLNGNNGSKTFNVMRTFILNNSDSTNQSGNGNGSMEDLNRRNGAGLLGNKCCMCIYGDFAKQGDKILKKSCDEQFAQNSCDKTKKFYARDADGVNDGITQFPDYCPATSYRSVHLFYEEHGDRDGEEHTMCYDFPTSIISTYLKEQGTVPENIAVTHGKCNAFNNLNQADAAAKELSETLADAGLVNVKVTVEGNQNNSGVSLSGGNVTDICAGKATYNVCSSYSERTLGPCPAVGSFCLPAGDSNTSMKCMEGNKTKTRTCKSEGYTENGTEYGTYQ